MTIDETRRLALAKLKTSGLAPTDLKALHLSLHTSATERHAAFEPLPAMGFNYLDPFTGKPLRAWPAWPPFYRVRYLKESTTFDGIAKASRYSQEPNSGVCAYFPTVGGLDWPTILADDATPLIITEGELKAAKACKEGFPTIGLGGVYNFRSSTLGLTFLDELKKINWVKRNVYLIYDSDYRSNEQVCAALNELASTLQSRGALPYVVGLPDVVTTGKTGLDDFLVARPPDDLRQLIRDRAQPLTLAQSLWQLNEKVLYVHQPGLVLVQSDNQKLAPSAFKDHAYATAEHAELVVKKDGKVSFKPISAAAAWLKWPLRKEAKRLTYEPASKPNALTSEGAWNVWPGWGLSPTRSATHLAPFLELVDHLFLGAEPEAKQWLLQWLAYPLQHPGVKLFSSPVIHGIRQGTGKSLIAYTMGAIYGKNFTEIKQKDLHASHNEWAESRQFVLADDVTGSAKRSDADSLKALITQKELRINPKFISAYTVPDCINYYFSSNQPDAFFLEDDDRRFFIHEVTVAPLPEEFYLNYLAHLKEVAAAVFHHLLRLDLTGFNPAGQAFRTRARDLMIQDVRSDLGEWVRGLLTDPDHVLRVGDIRIQGDLFTTQQLLNFYDPTGKTGTTANGLGRELRRAGVLPIRQGVPLHTSEGQARYYAVRNTEKWERAKPVEAIKHVEEQLRFLRSGATKKY